MSRQEFKHPGFESQCPQLFILLGIYSFSYAMISSCLLLLNQVKHFWWCVSFSNMAKKMLSQLLSSSLSKESWAKYICWGGKLARSLTYNTISWVYLFISFYIYFYFHPMEISLLFLWWVSASSKGSNRRIKTNITHKFLYEFVFYFFENSNNPVGFRNLCFNHNYLRNNWDPFLFW